jgi:hypothetical protein
MSFNIDEIKLEIENRNKLQKDLEKRHEEKNQLIDKLLNLDKSETEIRAKLVKFIEDKEVI